ncbi:hypothetical protein COGO111638_12490 [Corynebacterium gottingense]
MVTDLSFGSLTTATCIHSPFGTSWVQLEKPSPFWPQAYQRSSRRLDTPSIWIGSPSSLSGWATVPDSSRMRALDHLLLSAFQSSSSLRKASMV